ncbi:MULTISPECIES: hypothetical protein [unclassified Chitinophaga]|uniref:hypothetical protein n=1 Tax=unclassified Chitinophaga TaxID=2619133 RepID=UPI0015C2F9F2|nr:MULTISPECIES: hypothetical protein [unclassified Chitinophaga]WPV64548.1 hypothetical protein QQL36_22345 [Chitinophaga sp. LS1]WPV64549.1 hypothetical protein QQL36_22350 [Chitinophaga sp. LS1]
MSKIIPGYDCVAEVRRIREEIAAECDYDWDKIFARLETAPLRFLNSLYISDTK